jgi:hypothetical protein
MSVYVSIPTLIDSEIFNTVCSAVENADYSVSIGVAFMTPKEYYIDAKHRLSKYDNVVCKWFDPNKNAGIGIGRNNARKMYDGQDYILQVDAHTKFEKGWDTKLINMHEQAVEDTDNEKTIVTSLLGNYFIKDGVRVVGDPTPLYPVWLQNFYFSNDLKFTRWYGYKTKDFPEKFRPKKKVVPSIKFNGVFAFGNKTFAEYYGLPKDVIFFDEDIIQSINLLYEGYSLAFVDEPLPITHLDYDDIDKESERQLVGHLFDKEKSISERIGDSLNNFIDNPKNKDRCKYFEKYAGYRFRSNVCAQYFIPKKYSLTI